jgi:hypothetical protein
MRGSATSRIRVDAKVNNLSADFQRDRRTAK